MAPRFNTYEEARAAYLADKSDHELRGVSFPEARAYLWEGARRDYNLALDAVGLAMDAQPGLQTDPSAGIPTILTTYIDPENYEILFAPVKAAEIMGERKVGDWLMDTAMFIQVEHTGEVSSYGDFSENGVSGANINFPQRQSYLYQIFKEYGQRELERAGLARLNWVSEKDRAAATILKRFENLSYFFGINGLQNYGILNDPNLSGSLTPAPKSWGGTSWINNNVIVATANEIYTDIQSLFLQLVQQTNGLIDKDTAMTLAMSPESAVALTATNSFNVNVEDLVKKNFKNIKVDTAPQYGVVTASNPQGIAAGNFVQLFAHETEGQKTGYCSFNEKQKAFKIIVGASSFKQKVMSGTWGTVYRMPVNVASMLGV